MIEGVQDALDALNPDQPATITISGTCNEAIYLIRDDVTLQGDGAVPKEGKLASLTPPN